MYQKITLLVIALSSAFVFASTDQNIEAKAIMDGVYLSFTKIIPYVYNDPAKAKNLFENQAKNKELIKNLENISMMFQGAKHVEFFQKPGFRPSLDIINAHLSETIGSIKSGNYKFAQKRMHAMTSLCISCHTQMTDKLAANSFGIDLEKESSREFENHYAYANYLYLMRKFDKSITFYEKAITESLAKKDDQVIFASLRKIISIYTKIDFNYKKANSFIEKYESNKKLPPLAISLLNNWRVSLNKWKKFDAKKVKSAKVFVDTYLAPLESSDLSSVQGENDIAFLITSGVLTKFLSENMDQSLIPEALYWLAISERRLNESYFYSLSDLYLKECITKYSSSPFAPKCFAEYKENIEFGFSGSLGTDIPVEEKQELERLKKLLK